MDETNKQSCFIVGSQLIFRVRIKSTHVKLRFLLSYHLIVGMASGCLHLPLFIVNGYHLLYVSVFEPTSKG